MLELARLLVDPLYLAQSGVERGNGRPVVLLPGFLAGDQTLAVMAGFLRRLAYAPHTCGFVANVDCSDRAVQRIEGHINALYRRHGRRVALVGHSRGGHFARDGCAGPRPRVACNLTGRRPARSDRRQRSHARGGRRGPAGVGSDAADAGRAVLHRGVHMRVRAGLRAVVPYRPVRLTSIYSNQDGVVHWQGAVVPEADCVEVTGSHVGLAFNREAYRAIAHSLARPELEG
jgi:pimeloyl-ACP methyl ester carboxylesterase